MIQLVFELDPCSQLLLLDSKPKILLKVNPKPSTNQTEEISSTGHTIQNLLTTTLNPTRFGHEVKGN